MTKLKLPLMLLAYLIYLGRKLFTPIRKQDPQKILVLYLSGIGDIICLNGFYQGLRLRFPQSELVACLPEPYVKLQESFFSFDGYLRHCGYRETLAAINRERFDLIILPGWVLKDSLLTLFSNARAVLGYINDLSFSNRFVNSFRLEGYGIRYKPVWKDMRHSHLSERPSPIALSLGFQLIAAEDIVIQRQHPGQDYIVFHASSRLPSKRWESANFAAVADFLLDQGYASQIHLIGDNYDRGTNADIIHQARSDKLSDHAGKMSLDQARKLISGARLFLGNDSGPMHIAALSGVPTLGLLGPYPPEISRPLGQDSRHIFHRFGCTGCNPGECSHGYRCMAAITVTEVTDMLHLMLKPNDQDS